MQKESTVSHHPVSDPLTQAILLNEESKEIHRQRTRVALEREWAIEQAWQGGASHHEIARALNERPVWVREQLYRHGHDPLTQRPY